MNGKPGRFTLTNVYATGLLLVMLVWIANAWAFDPLFTMPDVIKEAKSLPGDTEAVTCPTLKDFSIFGYGKNVCILKFEILSWTYL